MIRDFETADAEAVSAALHEEELPHPVTPPGVLHWRDAQPERARARMWVAEDEGRMVGWAEARLRWTTKAAGIGDLWAYVVPAARGREIGQGLYEETERHLRAVGALVLESWTYTRGGERLLALRGFRAGTRLTAGPGPHGHVDARGPRGQERSGGLPCRAAR